MFRLQGRPCGLTLAACEQATGDEKEAIDLFKEVEKHHPIRAVRKQVSFDHLNGAQMPCRLTCDIVCHEPGLGSPSC